MPQRKQRGQTGTDTLPAHAGQHPDTVTLGEVFGRTFLCLQEIGRQCAICHSELLRYAMKIEKGDIGRSYVTDTAHNRALRDAGFITTAGILFLLLLAGHITTLTVFTHLHGVGFHLHLRHHRARRRCLYLHRETRYGNGERQK